MSVFGGVSASFPNLTGLVIMVRDFPYQTNNTIPGRRVAWVLNAKLPIWIDLIDLLPPTGCCLVLLLMGWEKSQTTTQHEWNPVNNDKFSILSPGAGFLNHQAVVHVSSPNSKIWNPKSCEPLVGRCFFSFHSFRGEFSDAPVDGWCTMVESVKISPWTNIIMD